MAYNGIYAFRICKEEHMLKIVRSGRPESARATFINEIKGLVEGGKKGCFIVPEQQTVMAEALMARALPPSAVLSFEVTNFTRLANTTFRALGGLSGEYCDSAKKMLIMWRAITELSPTLSMTSGRREINAGIVESSLAAVSQMQNLGIRPADLAEAAEHDAVRGEKRLESKLRDLSSIYALYKTLLTKKYADTGDDADAMIEKLRENPDFLSDTAVFIEGFASFTEPQYRLIAMLAARTTVSLALHIPSGMEEFFEYSEIVDTQERLIASARAQGADIKLVREEGFLTPRKESLDSICRLLWSTNKPDANISLQNPDELRIFEAATPYEECAFVCEDIKRRIIDGASYSDFAIVARSADGYQGILDSSLLDADIPAFMSYRRDINEFEAIKLIYTAYAAARGFRREDVISYAKCALSGVGREECDEFEMYVNAWQINGSRFVDGGVWNMNPLGYSVRREEGTDEKLIRIHNARQKIIRPLSALADSMNAASTVKEQAEVLLKFLLDIDLEGALEERATTLSALGEKELADENRALWKIICRSLDTLVTVLDDAPADAEAFLSQLNVVFSATDVGRIPSFADQVTVGSADMLRLYGKKHIYLIGVNAGVFPANVSDRSYFSEQDKKILNKCGLSINPELELQGARELYIFSRAFSYATESVTISYSAADTRFKAIQPAEVVGRIALITSDDVKAVRIERMPLRDRIFSPEHALTMLGELGENTDLIKEALVDSGYGREIAISEGDITNSAIRMGETIVDADKSLTLSQTKIDSYVSCPFEYFCKYLIRLQDEERVEFDARNIGSFIHAILENFFRSLSEQGKKTSDLSSDERISLTRRAAERYISQLGEDVINTSSMTRIKIDRLCRAALPVVEGLCDEFAVSEFLPRFFELSIGGSDSAPEPVRINANSGTIIIYGIIDRVDAYKRGDDVYLRVVDYKTGHKEFSPEDMSEGSNLQMFLYLKALVETDNPKFRESLGVGEGGRLIPAGVIYVKTSVRDVKIDTPDDSVAAEAVKSAQGREGMVINDPDVVSAMTLKYSPLYSKRSPDKIAKTKEKFLYTEEGWQQIMSTVEAAVCQVADGIRSGVMDAKPKDRNGKSPCEYCEFKPICRRG